MSGGREREAVGGPVGAALRALSVVYSGALHLHLFGYRVGLARATRLSATVVSIGNLTVGGTGKTTATMAVARWLRDSGRRVGVLSRGYRSRAEGGMVVVSEGEGPLVEAETAGDEPYMMAKRLPGVHVLVGKDRRRTGRMAIDEYGLDTLVLDDGFQYRRLLRDVDIALVDALDPFGYHLLVPAGRLREPPHHLARADAVWLTHCDLVRRQDLEELRAQVASLAPRARVWQAVHAPVGLTRVDGGEQAEPSALRGRQVCALSALGNPAAFERTLSKLGAVVVHQARFPDHHRYTKEELAEAASAGEAEWVVTTEKDAARMPAVETGKPLWVLRVEMKPLEGEPSLGDELERLLNRPDGK